jgi:hypothetical protein
VSYPVSAFVFTALILYALYLRRLRRAQAVSPSGAGLATGAAGAAGSATLGALQAFADRLGLRFETGSTGQDYTLSTQSGAAYDPNSIAAQAQASGLPATVVGGQVHVGLSY